MDKVLQTMELRRENAYLFLDDDRLVVEHELELFFDVCGEALDLRSDPLTWGNVLLRKTR